MDPEAANKKLAVIPAFVNQATPVIIKSLQKIEDLAGKSLSELLEVAAKVYNNRDPRGKTGQVKGWRKRMGCGEWGQNKGFREWKAETAEAIGDHMPWHAYS